jgi:hypothetical protein
MKHLASLMKINQIAHSGIWSCWCFKLCFSTPQTTRLPLYTAYSYLTNTVRPYKSVWVQHCDPASPPSLFHSTRAESADVVKRVTSVTSLDHNNFVCDFHIIYNFDALNRPVSCTDSDNGGPVYRTEISINVSLRAWKEETIWKTKTWMDISFSPDLHHLNTAVG